MEVKNVSFSYGENQALADVSLEIPIGKVTSLIGANGCGKTTLFGVMTKNLRPQSGSVTLDGQDISRISLKTFARQVAIVHQNNTVPADINVRTLVGYGRLAHRGLSSRDENERFIDEAIKAAGLEAMAGKPLSQLSGGQRQRAWIAMALAQNTKILLLDEPTTYLDIRYQIEVLRLVRRLNSELGLTVVMVLHDINQAIHYSDCIYAMKSGRIIAGGKPEKIITPDLLRKTYGVELEVGSIGGKRFVMTI